MKLQADRIEGGNAISSVQPDGLSVNGVPFRHSVVVPWQGEIVAWDAASLDQLKPDHFARLADLGPELVIFGSGSRLRFPPAALLRPLIERRIGVESMDTAAACRTYNILAGEGRSVVAALIVETVIAPV